MSVPGAAPGTKKAKAQSFAQVKPEEKAPAAAGSGSSRKPDRAYARIDSSMASKTNYRVSITDPMTPK